MMERMRWRAVATAWRRAFSEHPASVGESYAGHLAVAMGFGVRLLLAGIVCLIHGVLPCVFQRTGSRMIGRLHSTMVVHRVRTPGAPRSRLPTSPG
jgi:hypothetical protein